MRFDSSDEAFRMVRYRSTKITNPINANKAKGTITQPPLKSRSINLNSSACGTATLIAAAAVSVNVESVSICNKNIICYLVFFGLTLAIQASLFTSVLIRTNSFFAESSLSNVPRLIFSLDPGIFSTIFAYTPLFWSCFT